VTHHVYNMPEHAAYFHMSHFETTLGLVQWTVEVSTSDLRLLSLIINLHNNKPLIQKRRGRYICNSLVQSGASRHLH